MFFTDDDLHDGLKLSLDVLSQLTKQEKDPVNKRKCATALAEIILSLIKMQSDKEDWRCLMGDPEIKPDNDLEDDIEDTDPF
jgi:hypothetical protein